MNYLVLTESQLGAALKNRRKELGLTQVETGQKVGLLPKTISALEANPERASIASLLKLISALNLELTLSPKPQAKVAKDEW
ncbi:MAG TPA: helix-turn-helix domain-containing protein [Treponema sp.]|nr:helix-turn-helix domain-containing protein [Treponema sp.]